jgi:hypothetical protein
MIWEDGKMEQPVVECTEAYSTVVGGADKIIDL